MHSFASTPEIHRVACNVHEPVLTATVGTTITAGFAHANGIGAAATEAGTPNTTDLSR